MFKDINLKKLLQEMQKIITKDTWVHFAPTEDCQECVVTGLSEACRSFNYEFLTAVDKFRPKFEQVTGTSSITHWNDSNDRTFDDVKNLLETMIINEG